MWYSGSAQTLVGCSPVGTCFITRSFQASRRSTLATRVAVQQCGALGDTGGAAGVLQQRHVVRALLRRAELAPRPRAATAVL